MTLRRHSIAALLCAALTAAAFPAKGAGNPDRELASAWSGPETARSRVIFGSYGPRSDGTYLVGLELDLAKGWFTYWRSPGEAGAPPIFDWSASDNVADIRVEWPAPVRAEFGGYEVNGYWGDLVLPLIVTPRNVRAPVTLRLSVAYAACEDICVPAAVTHALTLPMGARPRLAEDEVARLERQSDALAEAARAMAEFELHLNDARERMTWLQEKRIERFMERVPGEAPEARAQVRLERLEDEGGASAIIIRLALDAPLHRPEVFVEGPRTVEFGRAHARVLNDGHSLIVVAPVSRSRWPGAVEGQWVRVTVVENEKAFETRVRVPRMRPQRGFMGADVLGPVDAADPMPMPPPR